MEGFGLLNKGVTSTIVALWVAFPGTTTTGVITLALAESSIEAILFSTFDLSVGLPNSSLTKTSHLTEAELDVADTHSKKLLAALMAAGSTTTDTGEKLMSSTSSALKLAVTLHTPAALAIVAT